MKDTGKTRRYYLAALAARTAAFAALVLYALASPEGFAASLALPWRWSPATVAWLALMVSMALRLFPLPVGESGLSEGLRPPAPAHRRHTLPSGAAAGGHGRSEGAGAVVRRQRPVPVWTGPWLAG